MSEDSFLRVTHAPAGGKCFQYHLVSQGVHPRPSGWKVVPILESTVMSDFPFTFLYTLPSSPTFSPPSCLGVEFHWVYTRSRRCKIQILPPPPKNPTTKKRKKKTFGKKLAWLGYIPTQDDLSVQVWTLTDFPGSDSSASQSICTDWNELFNLFDFLVYEMGRSENPPHWAVAKIKWVNVIEVCYRVNIQHLLAITLSQGKFFQAFYH